MTVKYPSIHVQLTDEDGNAFAILCAVCKAMQEAGVPMEERAQFSDEATRGDYDLLLRTCMEWVDVL